MFKLIVLLAGVVVVTVAESGNSHGLSTTDCNQTHVEIHSKPTVKITTAAPVIVKPQAVSSVSGASVPISSVPVASVPPTSVPVTISHQSRVDFHTKPHAYTKSIVNHAAPHLPYGANYFAAAPVIGGYHSNGYHELERYDLGYGNIYGYGQDLNYGLNYRRGFGHTFDHGNYGFYY